jgi:glycine/sarcosine N-methyltransferase
MPAVRVCAMKRNRIYRFSLRGRERLLCFHRSMAERILRFYEELADHYHLIFDDWDEAIARQGGILNPLLAAQGFGHPLKILDCACGIGTQALAFARFGHEVVASDLSRAAVTRAKREAQTRALDISFHVSDMASLAEIAECDFDVVVALDNALPHLAYDQLVCAARAVASKLKTNGLFVASIRDYDAIMLEKPVMQKPAIYRGKGGQRIVHQVWDWIDDESYTLHLFITVRSNEGWTSHHFASEYHCLRRNELSMILQSAGFREVRWLMPSESGFYQPIILARCP